ncbi:MAG: hypothetical protein M8354_03870 [Halalkalicoccus sp.]|nr:hypothetical protein [Halalkalicoccus sp.]
MTDRGSLEAAVRNEPEGFEDRIDEIHERLASADPHASADAGRTFRAVAEERPALLETHRETLVDLLSADNGSLRLSGAFGLAGLAEPAPKTVVNAIPELVALLERTDAPAVQMAILRALSRTGERTPEAVAVADGAIADLLRTATPRIRLAVLTVFATVPIRAPTAFPATVNAAEDALADDSRRVRRCGAALLALIARSDPAALSSVADVRERVETLRTRRNAQPWHADDTLERAARTLRAIDTRR